MVCTQGVENPIIIHSDVGTLREVLRVPIKTDHFKKNRKISEFLLAITK